MEDELLELILPCQTEMYYQRAMVAFARKYSRDARIGMDEGDQYLRRRTLRRTDYTGPANSTSRTRRDGKPFSWTEQRILNWFKNKDKSSESKKEVTFTLVS